MQRKRKTKGTSGLRAPALNPEQMAVLSSLLDRYRTLAPETLVSEIPSPTVAQALVEGVATDDPATPALLVLLGKAFHQRTVLKAIRKTVFKMRQKGISVPPELERDPGDSILRKPAEDLAPIALLGPIDRMGNRGVLVALPRMAIGYDAGFGVVCDTEGFVFFKAGTYGRKQIRDLQAAFLDNFGGEMVVQTSLSHVATILERAYQLGQQSSGPMSQEFLDLRPRLLDRAPPLEDPAIYQSLPISEVHGDALSPGQIDRLLEHPLLAEWVAAPQKLPSLVEEIKALEESPLLLSEHQKLQRIEEIKDKWTRESYTASERSIMKGRLEETAYILFHRKEEEYARLCITASRSLDLPESPIGTNSFLRALLNRSLDLYFNAEPSEEDMSAEDGGGSASLLLP